MAILFHIRSDYKIHKIIGSSDGRSLAIDVTFNDTRVTLINLYGPNTDDLEFFKKVFSGYEEIGNDWCLIGGDFNTVLDSCLDKKSNATHPHTNVNSTRYINEYLVTVAYH